MRRFRTRVAIQAPVDPPNRTPSGQVVDEYEPVTGLESVPATIVELTQETRNDRFTVVTDMFEVVLSGYRPTITTAMVVVGDEVYDIKSVSPTVGRRATVLSVERVSL